MYFFRLLLCSFFITAQSLNAMLHTRPPLPQEVATVSFDHIQHIVSPAILQNVALLKQNKPPHALLFSGVNEADFQLTIACIANETDCRIRHCSAQYISQVKAIFKKAKQTEAPTIIVIDDLATIDAEQATALHRHLAAQKKNNNLCIVSWTPDTTLLSENIQNYFNIPLKLALPTDQQRAELLKKIIPQNVKSHGIDINDLVQKTAGWSTANIVTLVQNSADNIRADATKTPQEHFTAVYQTIDKAKNDARTAILKATSLSYAKPSILFEELSGHMPKDLLDIKRSLKRNGYHAGILFHGPPGTGKSSLAEAIAADINWKYVRCNGSSFASSYQDGGVLRLQRAIAAIQETGEPTVLCLDECGALFNKPDHNTNSSHESLLAYLRKLIEDANQNKLSIPLLIIATTNDIHKIDAPLSDRFSGHTYKIQAPLRDVKKDIIAKLMSKVTNDTKVKETRQVLIKQICDYSEGLSIRPLESIMNSARELALNNHSKIISDRYFYEALKKKLLELAYANNNNKNTQVISTSISSDIKREIVNSIADDFENAQELKTAAILGLSLSPVRWCAKHIKKGNRLIWYKNAMHVGLLELEAVKNEISNHGRPHNFQKPTTNEGAKLLMEVKNQIYQTIIKQNTMTKNELLTLFEPQLNQIKTRIGVHAYNDLINRINNYYENI